VNMEAKAPLQPAITAQAVREALEHGELFLEYLPLIAVPEGRCVGAEALARWRGPGGLVMPDDFIPAIEETPVSGLLTYWVLETVAADLGDWLRQHDDVQLSINVPPEILGRGGLEYAANRVGLMDQAQKLVMEISERGLPDKLGTAALEMAHQLGIRIALDDVVFSGRNLVVLSRCSVHIIKIDRSLTAQIGSPDHPQPPPWLDHIKALHLGAGLEIIVEGVETREQVDTLIAAGVTLAQGFYYSGPLRAADFIAYHAAQPGKRPSTQGQ
jgi:sensor c-di-GMP phosphodiesterase-like protein